MDVKICKWYNGADAPVLFMVDDLANVWVDSNGNGIIDVKEDWGYAKDSENSSFRYLNEVILKDYPQIKTTFFVPVGPRVGMIQKPKIKTVSKRIDCDEETIDFFRRVNKNLKYEIAYHGTTHGRVGENTNDFLQEWETYQSLDEAITTINIGKEIYKSVFGEFPKGGKYCGYKSGEFGDDSINRTGFLWWNRYFNRGIGSKGNSDVGNDYNNITNFDIKTFGKNQVIDIPSTILGSLFNGILNNEKNIRGVVKRILRPYLRKKKYRELEYLLKNRLVISIQEHISPARDDGKKQTPNIFDDSESLKMIFDYLKNKNVWYCTGSELAEYVFLRENINIINNSKNGYEIYFKNKKDISKNILSLKFDKIVSKIIQPNNKIIVKENDIFNIEVIEGKYKIICDE